MPIKLNTDPFPADAFRPWLPGDAQTRLLRFCLHTDPETAVRAWRDWQALGHDPAILPKRHPASVRGVNNLLTAAFARHGQSPGITVHRQLRAQAAHDRLRSDTYRDLAGQALASLSAAGIEPVVLNGLALSELVYPLPSDRHCHDIDLMIRDDEASAATSALADAGFRPQPQGVASHATSNRRLLHSTGLPLHLHTTPCLTSTASDSAADALAQAIPTHILDHTVKVLPPHLSLIAVAAQAFLGGGHARLRWIPDLWFILHHRPAADWDAILRSARDYHLSGVTSLAAAYLHDELNAALPDHVIDQLARDAKQDRTGRDTALATVWNASRQDLPALIHFLGGRRVRLAALRWLFAPSPTWMRRRYLDAGPAYLPLAYIRRFLGILRRFPTNAKRGRQRKNSGPGSSR